MDETEELQAWSQMKDRVVTSLLGPAHDEVLHSMIPFGFGGALDLYYHKQTPIGTAIATMELAPSPDDGPSNELFQRYELAMFTREKLDLEQAQDPTTAFGRAHERIGAILNNLASFCTEATLNRFDTCEIPSDIDEIEPACLIFDALGIGETQQTFGLMVPIEIHRSEMEYARSAGGDKLLELLRNAGVARFSSVDRPAVV